MNVLNISNIIHKSEEYTRSYWKKNESEHIFVKVFLYISIRARASVIFLNVSFDCKWRNKLYHYINKLCIILSLVIDNTFGLLFAHHFSSFIWSTHLHTVQTSRIVKCNSIIFLQLSNWHDLINCNRDQNLWAI